jgi:hypothetical protein
VDFPGFTKYEYVLIYSSFTLRQSLMSLRSISLLREKAIASTAIPNDESDIEINSRSAYFDY